MRATVIAAVVLFSGSIAIIAPRSKGGGHGSDGSVATASSNGNGDGSANSGGSSGGNSGASSNSGGSSGGNSGASSNSGGSSGGNSGASSNSGGSRGGSSGGSSNDGHSAGVGQPVGAIAGPTTRSGGVQGQLGVSRPAPHVAYGQPYSAANIGRSNTGTFRRQPIRPEIAPGVGQAGVFARSGGSPPNHALGATQPRISRPTALLRQPGEGERSVLTTRDGSPHAENWSRNDPKNKGRLDQQTQDHLRSSQGSKSSWTEARHRQNDHHCNHHGRDWWHQRSDAVVLVDRGYWGCYGGWWYPAWGYDPNCSYYEYDGPIYGCNDLLPDEIVANVQRELQRLGYFPYEADGIFGTLTQEALARYQRDAGIQVTGVIDPKTLAALGFC